MNEKIYDITDLEPVSSCCNAEIDDDYGICFDCNDHSEPIFETEDGIFVDEDGNEY